MGKSETVWPRNGPDAWLPTSWRWARTATVVQSLHALSLFLLLSLVGALGMVLVDGLAFGATISRLPMLLHAWVPTVIGVVAASAPARETRLRDVATLIGAGGLLLIAMDLAGTVTDTRLDPGIAFLQGEAVQRVVQRTLQPISWVATISSWLTGGLPGVDEVMIRYPVGHPRTLVIQALAKGSTAFMLVGTVGLLLALRRWINANVTFRAGSQELVAGAVLGWIVAPSLSLMAGSLTQRQLVGAFQGGPLVEVLVPSAAIAALGVVGIIYALRKNQSGSRS